MPIAAQPVASLPNLLVADGSLGTGALQRYSLLALDYQHNQLFIGNLHR